MRRSGRFAPASVFLAFLLHAAVAGADTPAGEGCGETSAPDTDASSASSSSSGSSGASTTSGSSGSGGSGKGAVAAVALVVLGFTVAAPLTIAHLAIENDPPPCGWSFRTAPYADGAPGYLVPVATSGPGFFVPPERRRFGAGQVSLEGLPPVLSAGQEEGGALRMRVQSVYRVELEAAEMLVGVEGRPSLWMMGTEHFSVRFAESEPVQLRLGAGLRHGTDATGTTFGFDGLFGADIFWGAPLTTSLEITGGTYGNLGAIGPRGTVGVVVGGWEAYVGYQALWLMSGRSTAAASSPVVGVRAYF